MARSGRRTTAVLSVVAITLILAVLIPFLADVLRSARCPNCGKGEASFWSAYVTRSDRKCDVCRYGPGSGGGGSGRIEFIGGDMRIEFFIGGELPKGLVR